MNIFFKFVVLPSISVVVLSILVIATGCSNTIDETHDLQKPVLRASNHLNPILEEFLINNMNSSKSRADVESGDSGIPVKEVVEFYDSEKNLTMQAVETVYNGMDVIVGAYYSEDEENSQLLMVTETASDLFLIMSEDGEPLLEFMYDTETQKAKCTRVVNGNRVESYLCNGAMAVLGWEVSVMLAVPSGGSSLAFAVLWGVVTTAYCG